MKAIRAILKQCAGKHGLAKPGVCLTIENKPYMPLVIVRIGTGPPDGALVSVSHTYEQNGDLTPALHQTQCGASVRDPEIVFELMRRHDGTRYWSSVEWRNDGLGLVQEAIWRNANIDRISINAPPLASLSNLAARWNENLIGQGFVRAAGVQYANPSPG